VSAPRATRKSDAARVLATFSARNLYDNDGDLTARVIAIAAPDRANSHPHRNQCPHPWLLSSA
jgi:hypothetical protein